MAGVVRSGTFRTRVKGLGSGNRDDVIIYRKQPQVHSWWLVGCLVGVGLVGGEPTYYVDIERK